MQLPSDLINGNNNLIHIFYGGFFIIIILKSVYALCNLYNLLLLLLLCIRNEYANLKFYINITQNHIMYSLFYYYYYFFVI